MTGDQDAKRKRHEDLQGTRQKVRTSQNEGGSHRGRETIEMRLLISNIPDGADIGYIIDCIHRVTSDEIDVQQLED
jgi:hypothetical protein